MTLGNALRDLQTFADEWYVHYQANDWEWCMDQDPSHLADLLAACDVALTGHDRQGVTRPWDVQQAQEMLACGLETVQLSDGGYSRLTVDLARVFGEPFRLDRHLSRAPVIEAWDRLRGSEK